MKQKKNKMTKVQLVWQFIRLQIAGNVLFWGTYVGYFVLHQLLGWSDVPALATASILANFLFFLVDKEWVFSDKTGKRKTSSELIKFVLFMTLNYFINLGIITGLDHYFSVTPYIGQFVAGLFFTVWNYAGLKFFVFVEPKHHAITYHSPLRSKHGRKRRK